MKKCSGCGIIKGLEEFHKDSTNIDGRCYKCKKCRSKYEKIRYPKRHKEHRDIFIEYLKTLKCKACGYNKNWRGLQFHHRDPKEKVAYVSFLAVVLGLNSPKTQEEIKKCDVLCGTCHAIITSEMNEHTRRMGL